MSTRTFEELRRAVADAMSISDAALLCKLADEIEVYATPEARAVAENARGVAGVFRGDFDAAIAHCLRALEAYREDDHPKGIAAVTGNIGNIYKIMGDYPNALEYLRRAVDLQKALGERVEEAVVIGNIGILYLNTSDYPTALEYFRRALDIQTELDDPSSSALLLGNIGNVYFFTGDIPQALEHYQRAIEMHKISGDRTNEAIVTANIGSLHASTGDHQLALEFLRRALELNTAIGAMGAVASVTGSMCRSLIAIGDIPSAREHLSALDAMQVDLPTARIARLELHGLLLSIDGDLEGANAAYMRALEEARLFADREQEAVLHKALRDLAQKRNDFPGYIEHNNAHQAITDEVHGKEATQKLAMLEAEKRIAAERAEKEKHKALLYNTLPPSIAERVLRGEQVNDAHDMAAVMFMDLVGFTTMSSTMDPNDVVILLSEIFTTCDAIMSVHGLMKIKTIGDSYMAVAFAEDGGTGVTGVTERAARAALAIMDAFSREASHEVSREASHAVSHAVLMRIGLHCGPITAGVIGTERLQYDVWGDTVNIASRMESHGEPGRIHVSEAFAQALKGEKAKGREGEKAKGRKGETAYEVVERGTIEIKGKGSMTTYWLEGA
jgi:class 3 adenylate cyclase/Flp pilus assembly protein TadD